MQTLPRFFFKFLAPCLSLVSLGALAGCSSSSAPFVPYDAGSTSPDSGSPDGGGTSLAPFFCPTAPAASCGNKVDVCGVCVAAPTTDIKRTGPWKEYGGTGDPDLSCFDPASPALAPLDTANSKLVNMHGWVKIFANGPDSNFAKIEVFKEGPNGALGDKVGETVSDGTITFFADAPGTPVKIKDDPIQVQGQVDPVIRKLYPFEIKGTIPTETPLIVRTSSQTATAGWLPLYDYNIVARNASLTPGGAFAYDVRALGNDDYASILKAAYNRPPVGGQSAIAGEVHDCGDVRLQYATVGVSPNAGLGLFYLSDVEDNPLPSSALRSTAGRGLYAAGALKPGTFTVAALGQWKGKTVSLGTYTVQTFPDAVTAVSFRGLRPWQVPTK
jgi:hypothetical protein